ncbi:nickel pincer cofactor biosynthesis protein LarB [Opitutia bacterium ISCC 51]|nr:nickel pincer cofactor biosynthesis protein LarB [Opitutae bacterium ISCC 51]QXD28065.1 nickel pincer cofactor biosynthesis protein LarB [Opitutae bacterium ISCC 52]
MDEYNLDMDRENRLGFPEVVYGETKSAGLLKSILGEYQEQGKNALASRLQPEKGKELLAVFPDAFFDELSGSFLLQKNELDESAAQIGIICAGSSDLFAVNEALYTLNLLNEPAVCINDVGVAGIHRLLNRLDEIKKFKVLIVVAGFEGALPSVVGGLLKQPIIAVPTSIGYGVAEGGQSALHAMLSSCANGLTVTNIDNGYGAAMAAYRIIQLLKGQS